MNLRPFNLLARGRGGRCAASAGAAAALAVTLLAAAASAMPSRSTLAAPRLFPAAASASATLPLFSWRAVGGADHYEFQLAADPHLNSPVLGSAGHFVTQNTRATITRTPPDGRYWWGVRSVSKSGSVSGWSIGQVVKHWAAAPALVSPANDGTVAMYPSSSLVLSWRPVIGASSYNVEIATEPTFAKLVGGRATQTSGTSLVPATALAAGTYWWRVTPVDAERNEGQTSVTHSFHLPLRQASGLAVNDLVNNAPEFYDPQFSWQKVPGAARYELEINFSQDWSVGSRVCCSKPTSAISYSPTNLLDNNTYFWRVRPIDLQGNAGEWQSAATPFLKSFDTVPPLPGPSSIQGLHVRDNYGDGGSSPPGFTTSSPVVVWQPVAGASAYEVNVVLFSGGSCQWTARGWDVTTGIPAWTPLDNSASQAPYPTGRVSIARDGTALVPGQYCVRVRAIGDDGSKGRIYGDFTYAFDGTQPAFNFSGYPTSGGGATPSITAGDYHAAVDPLTGVSSDSVQSTPLLTWNAVPGATSYWVLVSRDASFTNLVDYAITRIPAYAPRRTYADETTAYYWAVLPSSAVKGDGGGAVGDPHLASPKSFNKSSAAPKLGLLQTGSAAPEVELSKGALPTFKWSSVPGARNYQLQVSTDSTFSAGILDNVTTDSTAYTSESTYPPGKPLYARVRASDENKIGLDWSNTQQFMSKLPPPTLLGGPRSADRPPLWSWQPLPYAVAYDLRIVGANGSSTLINRIPSPSFVATDLRGLGVIHWSVRGEFPRGGSTIPGQWSPLVSFTHTLRPPSGGRATLSGGLLFSWAAEAGARGYQVEISKTPDFSRAFDRQDVEESAYAPLLRQDDYAKGGTFYWHIAAVDSDGDTGNFGKTLVLHLPRGAGH
jgi:hypothetical protein